jgi:hypothetical protein
MTAYEVFETASAYLGLTAEENEDVMTVGAAWLNVLLAEMLETENTLRRSEGVQELDSAPRVTAAELASSGTDIDCHEKLLRIALPYGLAAEMMREDDADSDWNHFRSRFINALSEAACGLCEAIQDYY